MITQPYDHIYHDHTSLMTASDQTTPHVGGGGSTLSSLLGQILFVPFLGGGGLLGVSLSVKYSAGEVTVSTVQCCGKHCQ